MNYHHSSRKGRRRGKAGINQVTRCPKPILFPGEKLPSVPQPHAEQVQELQCCSQTHCPTLRDFCSPKVSSYFHVKEDLVLGFFLLSCARLVKKRNGPAKRRTMFSL